jgi:hypothetical protein
MKIKVLLLAIAIAFSFGSCKKTNLPVNNSPAIEERTQSESIKENENFISEARFSANPNAKDPDFDSGPNDPSCIAGTQSCEEVIITALTVAIGLKDAINNSTVAYYLSTSNISLLSNGTSNINCYDALVDIQIGDSKIINVSMANASGTKIGFLVGDNQVSLTHYDLAIIYKEY